MSGAARMAALLVLAAVGGCSAGSGPQVSLLPAQQYTIFAWLTCGDCLGGELQQLLGTAGISPGPTVSLLGDALFTGPPDSLQTRFWASVGAAFDHDTAYAHRRSIPPYQGPREKFVRGYWLSYDLSYRGRAVVALGRIATPGAQAVLDSASTASFVNAVGDTLTPYLRPTILHTLGP